MAEYGPFKIVKYLFQLHLIAPYLYVHAIFFLHFRCCNFRLYLSLSGEISVYESCIRWNNRKKMFVCGMTNDCSLLIIYDGL